ncbi:MAG: polysaccharide deacetylase family protein [Ktedonobacteraceae bacterium]
MDMFNPMPLEERPTQPVKAVMWQDVLAREFESFEERPTQPVKTVMWQDALTGPLPQTVVTKKRGNRLLYGFSLVLIALVIAGIFLGPAVYHQVFAQPASLPALQRVLHPKTTVVYSPGVNDITQQFMEAMLQKNWITMWQMLAPEAQGQWQGEDDFTHFEEAKFGSLTLQSYNLGQTIASSPWLNPDTTQVHTSAVTLRVALQAIAPPGLLTDPSNSALNQGLFRNTLFALAESSPGTWQVLIAGPADLDAPVLVPAKAPVTHVILPVFMYHHISSLPTHNLLDFNLTVTTANFNKQLDWMQKQGYQSITMTELFGSFYYGKALPPKSVIFTFDDGYADVYTYALPALLAHHYRGVFYIVTGMIGGRYMTWDQVRTLAQAGMEMAAHTIHHASLDEFPYTMYKTTPQTEITASKATLEIELGTPIQFFCYPSGEPFHHGSQYARQMVLKALFEDGYLGATLDPTAFNSALQNSEIPYQMPRTRVSGGEGLDKFIGILKTTLLEDVVRLAHLSKSVS